MSELAVKKLAEVEAFFAIAREITGRSSPEFKNAAPEVYKLLIKTGQKSLKSYVSTDMAETFFTKVEKTTKKLTDMMELYIGDEWNNPTEVLEWCSFFSGAGAAHCAIAAKLTDNKIAVQDLADLQKKFGQMLEYVIKKLGTK